MCCFSLFPLTHLPIHHHPAHAERISKYFSLKVNAHCSYGRHVPPSSPIIFSVRFNCWMTFYMRSSAQPSKCCLFAFTVNIVYNSSLIYFVKHQVNITRVTLLKQHCRIIHFCKLFNMLLRSKKLLNSVYCRFKQ